MRSVAVAAVSNIVQRSVRLYKAHRCLYTRFDDRFIVQASGEDSMPLLRAYTAFVVFGVLLVRSDNLQGCVHSAPTGTRYILQVDCWGFLFLAHGGIEQVWRSQFLLMSLRLFRRCIGSPCLLAMNVKPKCPHLEISKSHYLQAFPLSNFSSVI